MPSPRTFWRRRLIALAVPALAAGLLVGAVSGDEGARFEEPIRLTIAASGDLLIHGPVFRQALAYGGGSRYEFRPMLREARRVVSGADLGICHLEQPLTSGEPHGEPVFQAPAALAGAIAWVGWDACSTASNHALDGGEQAIGFTLERLDRHGVTHSGTNRSATAPRAAILQARGVEVALLAYTTPIPGTPEPANRWRLNMADADGIAADARAARRAGARAVIVSLHWGDEYRHEPSDLQRELARRLTRSPAVTAVIGQHVHVVQPIEKVNGKPVVFGEGNLLSNQTAACCPVESQDGLIALLDLRVEQDETRVERVRYTPTWVRHPGFQVVPAPPQSRRRTIGFAGRASWLRPTAASG